MICSCIAQLTDGVECKVMLLKRLNSVLPNATVTHTHTLLASLVVTSWPVTWQGEVRAPLRLLGFSLMIEQLLSSLSKRMGCVVCEKVSVLPIDQPIDRTLWALSSLREGNGWRSRVQHVILKTVGEWHTHTHTHTLQLLRKEVNEWCQCFRHTRQTEWMKRKETQD